MENLLEILSMMAYVLSAMSALAICCIIIEIAVIFVTVHVLRVISKRVKDK